VHFKFFPLLSPYVFPELVDESQNSTQQTEGVCNNTSGEVCEYDGEIGYWKSSKFISLTNYTIQCVGYVAKCNDEDAEGFLFTVNVRRQSTAVEGKKLVYCIVVYLKGVEIVYYCNFIRITIFKKMDITGMSFLVVCRKYLVLILT
jgi:hypothetical protein